MATIVTNANWLQVDGARLQKGKWDLSLTKAGVRLSDAGRSVNIPYMDTTIDGDPVESSADLFAFFEAQGFKSGGTGPGTGVQSVTGDGVVGTTENVVLTYPDPEDIGAATAAQGTLANTAVQPAAIANMVESQQEGGVGGLINNILTFANGTLPDPGDRVATTLYIELS